LATPPLGLIVTEPGGDFVARPIPESALVAAAPEAVIRPSRSLVAIKAVVSHVSSFAQLERPAKSGLKPVVETIRERLAFLRRGMKCFEIGGPKV
jgi:hypothetical protein